jgi:hypothetical protein
MTNNEQKKWVKDQMHGVEIVRKNEPKMLNEEITYKYSNKGKSQLRESVIIEGIPYFLKYQFNNENQNQKRFTQVEPIIEEETRSLRPPHQEEYPYEPYDFRDTGQPQYYLNKALKETIDSIYQKIKNMVSKFNDVDLHTIVLLSANIIGSYFQDRFSTVHYLIIVGENGTGKSAIGDTFEALGYRAISMIDATPATWFRVLGSVEYGQVTLIADEADKIGESLEVMSILKTGYQPKGKVFRMDTDNKKQQFFYPFCFKIIIAEKSPSETRAKGLLDRSFKIKTYKGFPQLDIKEIRNPQGNKERQTYQDEINDLRKILIMFKLIHFKDPLPEVDVGLDGRDKELCKPILQLFYGLGASEETLAEIETALQHFLDVKNARKKNSQEAVIYPIVTNAISQYGNEIATGQIWQSITDSIEGEQDQLKPNLVFHSSDYGKMYRNTVTRLICDKFGAEKKHKEKGDVLIFNDYIYKVGKLYDEPKTIKTNLMDEAAEPPEEPVAKVPTLEMHNEPEIKEDLGMNLAGKDDNLGVKRECHIHSSVSSVSCESGGQYQEYPPSCYYCNEYVAGIGKQSYEKQVLKNHRGKLCYPNLPYLEKYDIEPQGMHWEKE